MNGPALAAFPAPDESLTGQSRPENREKEKDLGKFPMNACFRIVIDNP
ncbi:hypothetical protein [Azospirillum argentinense]